MPVLRHVAKRSGHPLDSATKRQGRCASTSHAMQNGPTRDKLATPPDPATEAAASPATPFEEPDATCEPRASCCVVSVRLGGRINRKLELQKTGAVVAGNYHPATGHKEQQGHSSDRVWHRVLELDASGSDPSAARRHRAKKNLMHHVDDASSWSADFEPLTIETTTHRRSRLLS